MGRRISALFLDWLVAYGLAALLMTFGLFSIGMLSTAVLIVWFLLGAVSVRLFGFTPGQFALGLVVVPVDGRQHVGFGRALVRGLLIALVIPPLITDTDLRGLQDRSPIPRWSGGSPPNSRTKSTKWRDSLAFSRPNVGLGEKRRRS